MKTSAKRVIFWFPRVLAICYALFISVFALDVFGAGYSIGETILAFLIHLIPTFVVVAALIVAWRWEWIGAILFLAFGIYYLVSSHGEGWVIAGPLFLIAVLFLVNWIFKGKQPSEN